MALAYDMPDVEELKGRSMDVITWFKFERFSSCCDDVEKFVLGGGMRLPFRRKLRDGFFCVLFVIVTAMLFMNFQYWTIVSHGY